MLTPRRVLARGESEGRGERNKRGEKDENKKGWRWNEREVCCTTHARGWRGSPRPPRSPPLSLTLGLDLEAHRVDEDQLGRDLQGREGRPPDGRVEAKQLGREVEALQVADKAGLYKEGGMGGGWMSECGAGR